jgi:hydroxymethylglutaryl-CoA lyase
MAFPKKVFLRELGPREGFQTLAKVVPTSEKLQLITALSQTGVREIEVASFVRPDRVPQMADAEEVVKNLPATNAVRFTALYLNDVGFKRAENLKGLSNQGWIYLAASETFLKRNNNSSIQEVFSGIPEWLKLFDAAGKTKISLMISTAFGCNYEGSISEEKTLSILERAVMIIHSAGRDVSEISLADTMGHASPLSVQSLVTSARKKFPDSEISLHLHDTRGSGMANVYAGLELGVSTFDASVGGIGGCPFAKGAAGNVCTEDVAYLCERLGIETGLDLAKAVQAAKLAEKIVGSALPGKLYKTY